MEKIQDMEYLLDALSRYTGASTSVCARVLLGADVRSAHAYRELSHSEKETLKARMVVR